MKNLELAKAYFDAWNSRDADAIVETFCDSGTYTDPTTKGPLSGPAIGAYATGLWASRLTPQQLMIGGRCGEERAAVLVSREDLWLGLGVAGALAGLGGSCRLLCASIRWDSLLSTAAPWARTADIHGPLDGVADRYCRGKGRAIVVKKSTVRKAKAFLDCIDAQLRERDVETNLVRKP